MSRRGILVVCALLTASSACRFDTGGTAARDDAGFARDAGGDSSPGDWFDTAWSRRKRVTIAADQVAAGAVLEGFPVLISLTDAEIGAAARADGRDILFTDGDGVTPLPHELESYAPSGQLVFWVRVPQLTGAADTVLYLYYGNSEPATADASGVWDSELETVHHLHQVPGGNASIIDSTDNSYDGTPQGSMSMTNSVDGQIGRALQFDGGNDFVQFTTMDAGNAFTISLWLELAGSSDDIQTLVANSISGRDVDGYRLFVNTDSTSDRRVIFETADGNNDDSADTDPGVISSDVWTHLAVVVDRGAGSATIFVDGADATVDATIQNDFSSSAAFELARMGDIYNFDGILDELRIAKTLRSPAWIQTSYQNQLEPGGFHELGPEETAP